MASTISPDRDVKYILVTGGVLSGIGKGIISSSLGTILKACGFSVTSIKIDPYINIDAGTFSPYEHGEVFVLDDGGEVDLDLGNYERFLNIKLRRENSISTGKIYQEVIQKERRGDYLGKTVQVIPHITDCIQDWVKKVARVPVDAENRIPDVCIIELGGTIGDIESMPFIDAFRQLQFNVTSTNFCSVHVSLVPHPSTTGEQKSKPTQASVRELRGFGLIPDLIVARSTLSLSDSVRQKIAYFCNIPPSQVISVPDCRSLYRVPLHLEEQKIVEFLCQRLQLPGPTRKSRKLLSKWRDLAEKHDHAIREVKIALIGKYTSLSDSYISVIKALEHASLACNMKLVLTMIEATDLESETKLSSPAKYYEAWQQMCNVSGILVPGGFGSRGTTGKIHAIEWAREKHIPMLGICLGMQCAVIEFARNVLKWSDASSTEFDSKTSKPVVIEMPEHHPGQMGGTMRLGKRRTLFTNEESVLRPAHKESEDYVPKTLFTNEETVQRIYGSPTFVDERHRHRYEVNPQFRNAFEEKSLHFTGISEDDGDKRLEIMELLGHPYFVGVQYHPEYISRPLKPSAPYLGLILAASGRLQGFLARNCRMSPRNLECDGDDTSDDEMSEIASTASGSN